MNKNVILANFKKEIWEYKRILLWVPIAIAALMILVPALNLMLVDSLQLHNLEEVLSQADGKSLTGLSGIYLAFISGIFGPFIMAVIIVQLYYFLSCLFDERRDLSVFFWRSLPVSDISTILTKLFTGAFLIPGIFLLFATALAIFFAILLVIAIIVAGIFLDTSLWGLLSVSSLSLNILGAWAVILPMAFWLFPVYAWLMLASIFAAKAPFLWALLPVILLLSIEAFIVSFLGMNHFYLSETLLSYLQFSDDLIRHSTIGGFESSFSLFRLLLNKISIPGIFIGVGLLASVYWLRKTRSHA